MIKTTKDLKFMPMKVDALTLSFGAMGPELRRLTPPEPIPPEFRRFNGTKWNDIVSRWFFSGIAEAKFTPKAGIDQQSALRHVGAILKSFEPKHEDKEALCAYLLSLWFDDVVLPEDK